MNSTNNQSNKYQSPNEIRIRFTRAMSDMYQLEVPLYKKLLSLADEINQEVIDYSQALTQEETNLLSLEHHGAIRVGHASELFMIRRVFNVMGMQPVDYYDLSVAGIPVHSTAFRALNTDDLKQSPFRIFCSLLRLDLVDDEQLREQANEILSKRQIFPEELIKLIGLSEKQGGLDENQANTFIENALEVFRWHKKSMVNKQTYDALRNTHGLIADIVSFKGPHINHLTPKILDIDACQAQFEKRDIKAKAIVEGPPKRDCPILLRQTSFIAIAEDVVFSNGESGTHTARFGEVEQRGIALTPKGKELYDKLLLQAREGDTKIDYEIRLSNSFSEFPDTYEEIRKQKLGYFHYTLDDNFEGLETQLNDMESLIIAGYINISPMVYEDFLPVSAAGIFTSNLSSETKKSVNSGATPLKEENTNRSYFEEALGVKIISSFELYDAAQQKSIDQVFKQLGINS